MAYLCNVNLIQQLKFSTMQQVANFQPKDGVNSCHRKNSLYKQYTLAGIKNGQIVTAAELRLYWPANDCYACLWVNYGDFHASGSGRAGGYGYDKESASASASEAMRAAGIQFLEGISGRGESATVAALVALGQFLGLDTPAVLIAHA